MEPCNPEKPNKRPRMEEEQAEKRQCIICCQLAPLYELTKPIDKQSLNTLHEAASIHNFQPILNLQIEEYDDKLYYHRKCRATFTLQKTLRRLARREETPSTSIESRKSNREPAQQSSHILEQICIFCNKKTKYIKGTKTKEPLSQSQTLRSDERVRQAAMAKLDDRIMAITSQELVAAEARYHRSCYRNYMRKVPVPSTTTLEPDNGDAAYQEAEEQAHQLLFEYIRNNMFAHTMAMKMTDFN